MSSVSASGVSAAAAGAAPAAAAESDIDDFIYLMSHDVRASVRALLELPHWIREDLEEAGIPLTAPVAESIGLMNRHAGRLDRMLVDLLTYSRIGRMQTVRRMDLASALAEVLDELHVPRGVEIVPALDCEGIWIGERDILTLLGALIDNAIKHRDSPAAQIVVTAQRTAKGMVLGVADDGPGIPVDQAERVFGPMITLRPRDEVEGSGMGLAHVRRIAEQYGGSARIAPSPYGRGTLVEVRIPDAGP